MSKHMILYTVDGTIYPIGPFSSYTVLIAEVINAQEHGEFDILQQRVYWMNKGKLTELQECDLVSHPDYKPGTKSYVLNHLHCMLQELQTVQQQYDSPVDAEDESLIAFDFDLAFSLIEEVRDKKGE